MPQESLDTLNQNDPNLAEWQWQDALLALRLSDISRNNQNPKIWVKSRNPDVLKHWLEYAVSVFGKDHFIDLPTSITISDLLGGVDLSSTIATGKRVQAQGLLDKAQGKILIVPVHPSPEDEVLNLLLSALDQNQIGVIVIDRSENDEIGPSALSDRMALHIDLNNVSIREMNGRKPVFNEALSARAFIEDSEIKILCEYALNFGLQSMRVPMQSAQIAMAHARLEGRNKVEERDLAIAIRLCFINRAETIPELENEEPEAETPQSQKNDDHQQESKSNNNHEMPDDIEVASEEALLPQELLNLLTSQQALQPKRSQTGKQGTKNYNFKRGRPVSNIKRRMNSRYRADLIATLRTAAPWQRVRHKMNALKRKIYIQPSDFHIKRYRQETGSTTIFVVDASGSTALNRLGEAKGAIEMLLAESYARRDHVALVAVKGNQAELLLPVTRSLVRAKRNLTGLRGGGGTPLADGVRLATQIYREEIQRGRHAKIVMLTDGSANIDLEGEGGRSKAGEDAKEMAKIAKNEGVLSIIVDVNRLPNKRVDELAKTMGGIYVPMPFASAKNISQAIKNYEVV